MIRGYHFLQKGRSKYTRGPKFLERKIGGVIKFFDDQNVGCHKMGITKEYPMHPTVLWLGLGLRLGIGLGIRVRDQG